RMAGDDAAATGELERRVFHPLQVEALLLLRELAHPEAVVVLDGGLGPRAAHRCAGLELLEHMLRQLLALLDRFRGRDQIRQLMRAVVGALTRLGSGRGAEA